MHLPVHPAHLAPLIHAGDAFFRRSTRFHVEDAAGIVEQVRSGRPAIFVCNHGQLWPALWTVRGIPARVLVSRSGDGELLARILTGWGFSVSRGSSSRDGMTGARDALRALREGRPVGLAVDGPRGPRGEVQEGSLRLARRAGVPLVPLRSTGGTWILRKSWDHFEIPRPGGRIDVCVGPAIEVGPGTAGVERARREVAEALAPARVPGPQAMPGISAAGPGS